MIVNCGIFPLCKFHTVHFRLANARTLDNSFKRNDQSAGSRAVFLLLDQPIKSRLWQISSQTKIRSTNSMRLEAVEHSKPPVSPVINSHSTLVSNLCYPIRGKGGAVDMIFERLSHTGDILPSGFPSPYICSYAVSIDLA